MSGPDRRKLVERKHRAISIPRQCELLGARVSARFCISRSDRPTFGGLPIRYSVVYSTSAALGCGAMF
jgi:hypothetical protein